MYTKYNTITHFKVVFSIESQATSNLLSVLLNEAEFGGHKVGTYKAQHSNNQVWIFEEKGHNTYVIKNKETNHVLDVRLGNTVYDACLRVGTSVAHYRKNQLWVLEQKDKDVYVIRSRANNKVLEVFLGEHVNSGHRVGSCPAQYGDNQLWTVLGKASLKSTIINVTGDKICLKHII